MHGPAKVPWWKEERETLATSLFSLGRELEGRQRPMLERQLENMRLYDNRNYQGLAPHLMEEVSDGVDLASLQTGTKDPIVINAMRSAIDTANARICQERPRVMVITEGGNWNDRNKARHMQKAVDGLLDTYGAYTTGERLQGDSMVCRFGIARLGKTMDRRGKPTIYLDWTAPWKWLVDETACQTAPPRQLYYHDWFPLEYLKEAYGATAGKARKVDLLNALDEAAELRTGELNSLSCKMVEIWEAWSIDAADGKPGRHVICCRDEWLIDESWEPGPDDDPEQLPFPVEILRWSQSMVGFSGISAADEVRSIQMNMNRGSQANQRADHAGSFVHVVKEGAVKQEDMPDEILSNEEYVVWPKGVAVIKPDVVGDSQRMWPLTQMELMYNVLGVSSFEANPGEPDQQLSGTALRTFEKFATVRFSRKEAAYGRLYLRFAKRLIRLIREIAKDDPEAATVITRENNTFRRFRWTEVDLPDENFKLQMFNTSQLPRDPAGKLQYVQEMIATGFIDPAFAATLFDMPDVESYQNIRLSAIRYIGWLMDEMLYEGRYHAPTGMEDLTIAMDWAAASYMFGMMHGADPENLALLEQWRLDAAAMRKQQTINEAQQAAEMQRQAMEGAGLGAGPGTAGLDVQSTPQPLATGGAGVPPQA